ncbi:MAG: ATP synthase subunit I [Deltaproteobacteria bacterium]|nr:ATP synthase subunit I [Deltaproteobacteria bacterium]
MTAGIRNTQKRYGTVSMMAAVFVGMVFIVLGYKPLAKGVVLGGLFSVLNFVLIGEILPIIVGNSRKRASFVSLGSILLRYLLMAVPLFVALKLEWIDFTATAVGLFMVQFMILGDHLLSRFFPTGIKQTQD